MFAVVMSLAAVASVGATPTSDQAVETSISHCLGSFSAREPKASDAAQIPPGLIEGNAVSVAPIAGAIEAFSYEGTRPRVVSCGVAIYGPVSPTERQRITALITAGPKWKRHTIQAYDLSKQSLGAKETYWGDPLAPSMIGVAMLSRRPSARAPTLEVQYHSVMVQ
jgi:hypothetical protein